MLKASPATRPRLIGSKSALLPASARIVKSAAISPSIGRISSISPAVVAAKKARAAVKVFASAAPAAAPAPFKWGANMKDLGISIAIAVVMWFMPAPAGVTLKAWHLLSVFVGTIVGIITTPLPLGAVAMLGMGAAMLTKVLTFPEAFSAFASEIP